MKQYSGRHKYNISKHHFQSANLVLQGKLSSAIDKEQKTKSSNVQQLLRSSGSYLERQKKLVRQNCTQLNKSAEISYFINKERTATDKSEESSQTSSYTYIGQIQALQRRKMGRKSFYKYLKMDKNAKQSSQTRLKQQKGGTFKQLNDIVINDLKGNISINQSKKIKEVEIEELHYKMVITQQKFKRKCMH